MKLLTQQGKVIGGISTPEIRQKNRVGFEIVDIMTGKRGILAHINQQTGPWVSRYRVNLHDLKEIGVGAIRKAIDMNADFIIIDEIGKMELVSQDFQAIVWEALDLKKVLGTIGHISAPFITRIYGRNDIKLINLTTQNRDEIYDQLKFILLRK